MRCWTPWRASAVRRNFRASRFHEQAVRRRIDRDLLRAARGAGRHWPARRCRDCRPKTGPRYRRDQGYVDRRSALLYGRSAGRGRPQGLAGEPLRSCRQGRGAFRFSSRACLARGLDGALARGFRARARRRCRGLQMSAARRRHREESLGRSSYRSPLSAASRCKQWSPARASRRTTASM